MISCCERLIQEHRQTEALLARLEACLEALSVDSPEVDWLAAKKLYALLAEDLYRHFVLEEQALFALLSPYRTMMLMEVEHDDLLTLQHAFERALIEASDASGARANFLAFKTRLLAHIVEEERGIFPLADARLEPEEKAKLLRLMGEVDLLGESGALALSRPQPEWKVSESSLFQPFEKPLAYQTLYEREHASVQQISLKAGQRQVLHWVGQHQCLVMISGTCLLETAATEVKLLPGMVAQIDSRLYFALKAVEDSQLLAFKVWPHPHYTKAQ